MHDLNHSGTAPWPAPSPRGPISATIGLPGSKSLTNRELVLSAIAAEPTRIRRPLHSRDTDLMVDALRALGAQIDLLPGSGAYGADLLVTPHPFDRDATIDCGLAGTVMRFVPPVAALSTGRIVFDGDERARQRPMSTTIDSLRALGVAVESHGSEALPFDVHGTGTVNGGSLTIDASASSQFVSGLMLVAPRFARGLDLQHEGGQLPSLPHIEMTIACLIARGAAVTVIGDDRWRVDPGALTGGVIDIEPDLSNAAPFLAAAAISSPGSAVTITDWPAVTTQVGDMFPNILELMGARVSTTANTMTLTSTGGLSGLDLDLSACGELTPTVAAVAALASGPSTLRGIAHLRGHETDRLAALATEINSVGGHVTEHADGLDIDPRPLHGGLWRTYGDHRMATAGALLGLAVPGILVEDIDTTAKTLPEFVSLWSTMLEDAPPAPTAPAAKRNDRS